MTLLVRVSSATVGGAVRTIEIGAQMVENEKVETSANGSVQLLFIDKTTLNIGPHSSVVIDKFVFNPMTTQGELAVTLSKGALQLVGGQATHTSGCQIGVFAAYVSRHGHAFIDRALYLPKAWTDAPARMAAAHVPARIGFATKPRLALAMIARAIAANASFASVADDTVYVA
jgi:SRSO17 transposase